MIVGWLLVTFLSTSRAPAPRNYIQATPANAMDIVNIILFCFMSCIVGAVVLLLVQYYVFIRYLDPSQEQDDQQNGVDGQRQQRQQQQQQQPFELPDVSAGRADKSLH